MIALNIIESDSLTATSTPSRFATFNSGISLKVLSALSAMLISGVAVADPEDPLNFSVGAGVRFEDNLFRLPDNPNNRPAGFSNRSRSDQIYSTNVGIKIDKPYAQQRFQLNMMATDHDYKRYDYLDYTTFDYRAAWLWHLTPDISGTLSAEQVQISNNFADFRNINQRSIQTNEIRTFSIDGHVAGGWHLIGALTDLKSRNTQQFSALRDFTQTGVEAGVKYVAISENWVSLVQKESKGDYNGRPLDPVSLLDNSFDQHETEARANWRLSGKSVLDGRLGYVNREHDHFSDRDYSGEIGQLTYRWEATGKLQVNTSITRNIYSFQLQNSSYYVADTISIAPTWRVTSHTTVRARYDYGQRDYRGAIVPGVRVRDDDYQTFLVAVDWQPRRTILVNGTLLHEKRSSNINSFDYDANSFYINAQLLF